MVVENRRRAERQFAIWMGSCLVEGEAPEQWQDCGVFDFAALGLGMDLHYASADDLVGRQILVCLPVGPSMDVTLTGAVRNAKGGPDGTCGPASSSSGSRRQSAGWSSSWRAARCTARWCTGPPDLRYDRGLGW